VYALLVMALIVAGGYLYYQSQEKLAFSAYRIKLMEYASDQIKRLHQLHVRFPQETTYPRDDRFESAIVDLEYVTIFSTLRQPRVNLEEEIYRAGDRIHFVKILDNYYLGAKYLVVEVPEDTEWFAQTLHTIEGYGLGALGVLMLVGWFLARLFTRPMRHSIELLDQFIKDTTHELNTPLSAILANIETIDTDAVGTANAKRLRRINIAARTVSTLYEDLTFATLEQDKSTHDVVLDMREVVAGRLELFDVLMESKRLILETQMEEATLTADRRLIERVVDNLLSNAIKYNRRGGTIRVTLRPGELVVEDTGVGIDPEVLPVIFERYARFNESEGGFGIGLSIVRRIVDHYGMTVTVQSQQGEGTTMTLCWQSKQSGHIPSEETK
jgi:two-component system OmpR family sensor kinase